jgi:hypothetical protein
VEEKYEKEQAKMTVVTFLAVFREPRTGIPRAPG